MHSPDSYNHQTPRVSAPRQRPVLVAPRDRTPGGFVFRSGLIVAFTLALLFLSQPAGARAMSASHVTSRAHGITLTLTLPGGRLRRDSAIRGTVRVTNITHHPVYLQGYPWACGDGGYNPAILVLNVAGKIVYPPTGPTKHCPYPRRHLLRPGQTLTAKIPVVLRAPLVQARVLLAVRTSQGPYTRVDVRTPRLRLRLS